MSGQSRVVTVCAALNAEHVRYLLAGAQAGILWGYARLTRDIDLVIEPTPENAQRVLEALSSIGFQLARDYSAQSLLSRRITVLSDPFYHVDIMTVAWSVQYQEASTRARVFDVDGVQIPALSLDDLIASKRTGRLQDAADIEVLEKIRAQRRG